jgi:hypothetical protein
MMSIQLSERNNIGRPLIRRERKRHIERHPALDQVQAINQAGVLGEFPGEAAPSP